MIQCQSCGDTQGPWVHTSEHGMLCEDCYNRKNGVEKIAEYIKAQRRSRPMTDLDVVGIMDSIAEEVYEYLGMK